MEPKKRKTNKSVDSNTIPDIRNIANERMPDDAYASKYVNYKQELTRIRQDIASFRAALMAAERINFPNRMELYRLYKEIIMDAQVSACIQTRLNAILGSKYIVTTLDGDEDKELTKLFQKKWFYDFIGLCMDSKWWGYSLIQFKSFENDEFESCELAIEGERQYVKQEFSIIVETPAMMTGWDYTKEPLAEWCLGVGGKRDLGLLAKLAPLYLWKKGALQAWSNYNELFGVPIRIGKTHKRDANTVNSMENFLKNMGNSAWGIFDIKDEIQLLEGRSASGQDVFNAMIDRCNSEIAKLILGQSGTTDEKSYAGSAEVHERVLKMVYDADERFIENVITHQLIPFLTKYHGFNMKGYKLCIEENSELTLLDRSKIDLELLQWYDIPAEYILNMYGTPVVEIGELGYGKSNNDDRKKQKKRKDQRNDGNIDNSLDEYYGE